MQKYAINYLSVCMSNYRSRSGDFTMLTSKIPVSSSALQTLPLKMPEGVKTKVLAPRNPKLVKREEKDKKVNKKWCGSEY